MKEDTNGNNSQEQTNTSLRSRKTLGVLIILSGVIYTLAVIMGYIPKSQRIDTITLAVIGFTFICGFLFITPNVFDRLKIFEVKGIKLEMLEKVKEKQDEQEKRLDDIALILPLLLPEVERRHLSNLADGKTTGSKGNHTFRSELRHLRTVGLIKSLPSTAITNIKDGLDIDLAKFVELTTLGKRWVKRIKEIEQAEVDDYV